MKFLGLLFLLTRLAVISILALSLQIYLAVEQSKIFLMVQNWVHSMMTQLFSQININPAFQVSYNFLNGDGIIVHTLFVLLTFVVLYPLSLLIPSRSNKNNQYLD